MPDKSKRVWSVRPGHGPDEYTPLNAIRYIHNVISDIISAGFTGMLSIVQSEVFFAYKNHLDNKTQLTNSKKNVLFPKIF